MARRKGPKYIVLNLAGEEVAGSDVLDDALRGSAAKQLGRIINADTGETIYDNTPKGPEQALFTTNKENDK